MYDPLRLRQFCASFDYRANLLPIPWDSLGEKREEKKKGKKEEVCYVGETYSPTRCINSRSHGSLCQS